VDHVHAAWRRGDGTVDHGEDRRDPRADLRTLVCRIGNVTTRGIAKRLTASTYLKKPTKDRNDFPYHPGVEGTRVVT
jgi:hypothetical protein